MANATKLINCLFFLTLLGVNLSAQQAERKSLHDALLDIALSEGVSLIFEPSNVPDIKAATYESSLPLSRKLDIVLAGTRLQYELKNDQIFLYKERAIYGYIEDGDTGERLISATFTIPSENIYDISNEHGYFTLTTIKDSVSIVVSYLGYRDTERLVDRKEMGKPIIIKLYTDNSLDEVLITDALVSPAEKAYIELDQGSDILLHQNQAISAVGGEPDIFQAVIRQSGVNAGTDGLGGIHIRGGRNDQNLILYDGVKLYNSAHAFGLFSIINNNVIDQAKLYKSGSNGALTGRLSSIMDIKTKDPALDKIKANIQVTTLASQLSVEGPLIKDRLGLSITGRRTHVDPLIKSLSDRSVDDEFRSGNINYNFSDFNIKMYGKLSNKSRMYLTMYKGSDHYTSTENFTSSDFIGILKTFDDNTDYQWGNELASLRYNTLIGTNTFLNVILSSYTYNYDNTLEYNRADSMDLYMPFYERSFSMFNSGISSYDIKVQAESVFSHHEIKYGLSAGRKDFNLGIFNFEDVEFISDFPYPSNIPLTNENSGNYIAREATFHLTDKFRVSKNILLDAGIYYTYIDSKDIEYENELSNHQVLHGYLKAMYRVGEHFHCGFTVGKYTQTEHLLTVGDNGYPNDIWLPSTELTPPQQSYQYEVFFGQNIKNHQLNLSVYYKTQDGLMGYSDIAALPSLTDFVNAGWETLTTLGTATGHGVDLDYSYHASDKFTLRGMYTYGMTDHQFPSFNNGEPFPYDFSILHTISLGMNATLYKNINLSVDWYYSSGKPYTRYEYLPAEDQEPLFSPLNRDEEFNVFQIGQFNGQVLPASHKLSFSLSTFWNWGKSRHDVSLGIQNVYGRANELYRYEVIDLETEEKTRKSQTGFPLLPMFRWRVSI